MAPLLGQRSRPDRGFERLYQRHVSDVYHYALAVLRNSADAEDVTQTTFLNAYRAYERGERPHAPQNWLITIAHNVCRQRFRQSARRPREVAFDEDVADTLVDDDDAPNATDIRRALGHLAFNQRAALVMRELEGRSYNEIAEILGISVGAVETLIFRARRALREQLEGSLTCREAELAISKQLDNRLPRGERGMLRAHLRECPDCARFARSQRAQRAALRSIAAIPLPGSLATFFGGGSAAGVGLVTKAAVAVAAVAVVGGVGYQGASTLDGGGASGASGERGLRTTPAAPALVPIASDATGARPGAGRPTAKPERSDADLEGARGAKDHGQARGAGASHRRAVPPGQAKQKGKANGHRKQDPPRLDGKGRGNGHSASAPGNGRANARESGGSGRGRAASKKRIAAPKLPVEPSLAAPVPDVPGPKLPRIGKGKKR